MRKEYRVLPQEGAPSVSSIAHGYNHFRLKNAVRCECGHQRFEHAGLCAPGCSYLGTCTCPRFTRAQA